MVISGLLGSNSQEKFTDKRLLDGSYAASIQDILPEFVVAGPPSCKEPRPFVSSHVGDTSLPAAGNEPVSLMSENTGNCEPVSCKQRLMSVWDPESKLILCYHLDSSGDLQAILVIKL